MTEPTQRRSQPKPKMTPKKVGELLGLRPAYVLDLARRDELPHVRIGRYTRFDEAD